jgi:UDP-N-acetyl-D-mannosaminuronic acid dehydrogenase
VLPGRVVTELVENDRVIGGLTRRAAEMARDVYRLVVEGECVLTDARTAEMCKLTENSYRDVNIAFANELSIICDKLGIDVWELISLANRHPRVKILQPGPGVGGHCIAVDPWFIVDSAPDEARLVRTAREVNDGKPLWVLEKVKAAIADVLAAHPERRIGDVKVACLGLSFKPDIDDLRESPALCVAQDVAALGCQVLAVEPHIDRLPEPLASSGAGLYQLHDALRLADIICVLARHRDFLEDAHLLAGARCIVDPVGLLGAL